MSTLRMMTPGASHLALPKNGPNANAHLFNGSSYAYKTSGLAAGATSKTVFFSLWIKLGVLGTNMRLVDMNSGVMYFYTNTNNTIQFNFLTGGYTNAVTLNGMAVNTLNIWNHYCGWANTTTGSQVSKLYRNGVDDLLSATNIANALMGFDAAGSAHLGYGARYNGAGAMTGELAEFYLENDATKLASLLSLPAAGIPGLFRTAAGKPKSYYGETYPLGTNGQRPLGFQPLIYLPGVVSSSLANAGRGGDLDTVVGSIPAGTS